MNPFFRFMAGPLGRSARVIAGLVLIAIGVVAGGGWWVLAVIGLVPLLAGVLDVCLFAPVFGRPFSGGRLRETCELPAEAMSERRGR